MIELYWIMIKKTYQKWIFQRIFLQHGCQWINKLATGRTFIYLVVVSPLNSSFHFFMFNDDNTVFINEAKFFIYYDRNSLVQVLVDLNVEDCTLKSVIKRVSTKKLLRICWIPNASLHWCRATPYLALPPPSHPPSWSHESRCSRWSTSAHAPLGSLPSSKEYPQQWFAESAWLIRPKKTIPRNQLKTAQFGRSLRISWIILKGRIAPTLLGIVYLMFV